MQFTDYRIDLHYKVPLSFSNSKNQYWFVWLCKYLRKVFYKDLKNYDYGTLMQNTIDEGYFLQEVMVISLSNLFLLSRTYISLYKTAQNIPWLFKQ